ncbi:MAG: hypothetical protein ACKKMR_01780 [Candidatus Nealsonbacteria bacterium]
MGCTNVPNDRDDELLKQAREGKFSQPDPEMLKEVMPKVRETIKQRVIELKEEGVEKARGELIQRIEQEGREPTDIEKLDLEVKPTEAEYQEMYKIGTGLGMKEFEIFNTPAVTGIKDIITLERIDNIEEKIKDAMTALYNSKLSIRFRDIEVVDKIIFISNQKPGTKKGTITKADVLNKETLKEKPELSRTIHVYQNEKGKLPRGKQTQWRITHELCHLNIFKSKSLSKPSEFAKIFFDDHLTEWEKVCEKQLDGPGPVSQVARECLSGDIPKESAFSDPEFIAENIAAWDTGLVKVCPEMEDFLNKYISEQ